MIVNRLAQALEVLERGTPTTKALEPFHESGRERFVKNFATALDLAKAPMTQEEFESMLADMLDE